MATKKPILQSYSGYCTLHGRDQARPNWVLLRAAKPVRKRPPEIPLTLQRLLGPANPPGGLSLRDRYRHLRCANCGGLDPEIAFEEGFDEDLSIRLKGDFGWSSDQVPLISQKFLDVLRKEQVNGYEVRPIGSDGYYALKVTHIVEADPAVITRVGEVCTSCGRPTEAFGVYKRLSQVCVPAATKTLFSPQPRRCSPFQRFENRDIMLTGDVLTALKRFDIKADSCHRLKTEEEWQQAEVRREQGDHRFLPGTCILLY